MAMMPKHDPETLRASFSVDRDGVARDGADRDVTQFRRVLIDGHQARRDR